jgi:hypothetical protein
MAILGLTTTPASAGVISYFQITNDEDSGIIAGKTYTHKLDFGTGSPGALINGVQFDAYNSVANGTLNFHREATSGSLSDHAGNDRHNVSGGLVDLMTDMYYNSGNEIGGSTTWTLSGLTPGQHYSTRIYTRQWQANNDRTATIVFDPDGAGPISDSTGPINQDDASASPTGFTNANDAYYINYQFTAVAGEDLVITVTQNLTNESWHLYGLTNEIDEPLTKAHSPSPKDGVLYEATWVNLRWTAGDYAASHNVYLGDNFDDVNNDDTTGATFRGNQPFTSTTLLAGFFGFPFPDGLVPGKTYYWRIDEVNEADPDGPWKGDVWSFRIKPAIAYDPRPSDGSRYVEPDVELSWTAGMNAKLHSVHFGDNFDDVNNATGGAPMADTTFTPGTLDKGKTYYWRVDESNPPNPTVKGDVWTFTMLPDIQIADPNLFAWWTFDEGAGGKVVDWSGHGNHAIPFGSEWVDGKYGDSGLRIGGYVAIENLRYAADDLTEVTVAAWIRTTSGSNQYIVSFDRNEYYRLEINGSGGGTGQIGWDVMTSSGQVDYGSVTRIDDGQWHHVAGVFDNGLLIIYIDGAPEPSATGGPTYGSGNTRFGFIGANSEATGFNGNRGGGSPVSGEVDDIRIYHRALTQEEIAQVMRGDLRLAWAPSPRNGSQTGINLASKLKWSPGDGASQHDVYFGLDRDAVAGADASDTTGVYNGRQNGASYTPEGVTMDSGPFYWRIDEIANDDTITKGNVWTFSVANYVLVEDFESYNDIPAEEEGSNLVYLTWTDGFDNPTANGSTMGYVSGASMETSNVHGGKNSVPFQYNNTTTSISEVVRSFAPGQDWTVHGVNTLSLWFFGDQANTLGRLYVKINGVRVTYDGDVSNLSVPAWQVWNIDLGSVGTNLRNIISLAIGIQGPGATGTLLLDDIRLYRQGEAPVGTGVLEVPRTSAAPIIDGKWDNFWNNVDETRCLITDMVNATSETPEDAADLSAVFKAAYDNNNFYVFIEIQDSVIDYEFSNHNGDSAEIYFDGDISRGSSYDGANDNQIRISVDDVVMADIDSSLPVDGAAFKVLVTDMGYNIEASFPLVRLQISPLASTLIGFEMQINDNDNSGGRQTILRWYSDDNNSWQDPSLFGVARLVSNVVGQ